MRKRARERERVKGVRKDGGKGKETWDVVKSPITASECYDGVTVADLIRKRSSINTVLF